MHDFHHISPDGRRWIRDCRALPGFPAIDPSRMDDDDRDALVAYLSEDDGSLGAEALEFSRSVADEIANL